MVATTAAATKEETEDKNTSAGPDKAIPQTAKLDVAAKAITDQGAGGPPVPTMAGADPQGGPLAAVESTTSQMDPPGVPKTNSEEASPSVGVEPEPPPGPTPQPARRIPSISRAEKDTLSLSKPAEPLTAPTSASSARGGDLVIGAPAPMEGATLTAGGLRRVPTVNMTDAVRQLFVASPAYPGGVEGVITSSRSIEAGDGAGAGASSPSQRSSLGRDAGKQNFRMVFDKTLPVTPGRGPGMVEMGLPVGLEATCDEKGGGLTIRELRSAAGPGGAGDKGAGGIIARIEELPYVDGAGEAVYGVVLDEGGGAGELMAVRVSKHPTRLTMPREVRAVLLLPSHREDSDGRGPAEGKSEISVWDRGTRGRADGLWEAAGDGKVSEDAFELHSKAATWSSTTKSFELDLLEAWRPGRIGTGSSPKSSQPAPETVQMVPAATAAAKPSSGNGSARSSSSSARGRLPSMQLIRVNSATSIRPTGAGANGNGHTNGTISGGNNGGGNGGGGGSGGDGGGGASWMMAAAAPMPVLHGFCLAVIGLTTGVVGENVTLVDRSVGAGDEEAAMGFLGFDQSLTDKREENPVKLSMAGAPGGGAIYSARSEEMGQSPTRVAGDGSGSEKSGTQAERQGKDRDKEVTPLPLLALGEVEAPASAREKHDVIQKAGGEGSSRASSSRHSAGSARAVQTSATPNAISLKKRVSYDDARKPGQRGNGGGDQLETLGGGGGSGGGGGGTGLGGGGGTGPGGGGVSGDHALPRTVPIPIKRRMTVTVVASVIVDKVYRNTYLCNLCLLTLTVSFAADLYPGVPSHNVPLSAALLWASCNVDGVRALRRRSFAYALSALVLISLFIDVDFLASALKPYALSELEQEDDDLQGVIVGNHMHAFGRIIVGIVAVLQALSWQGLLATSPQGVHALNLFWRRFKLFLPVWGSPRKLTKEVYNRVVALAWIHLLGPIALIIMAGVGALGFGWAPQFASSQGAGVPLVAICFLKSMSGLLVSAAIFRNMDLALCLNVFGCLAGFQGWHRAREERRRARHGMTYPKVILEWDYILLCGKIKIFDLVVGLWLWIGLGWSWSEDRDYAERYSIRMLLIAVTTVQTLTDVWSVFLGITVSLLVSQYLLRKEKSVDAARTAFGAGGDNDVEIARRAGTGRLLASPPMSSDASSVGEAGGRGGSDMESSDADSYSTGESETDQDDGGDATDDGNRQNLLRVERPSAVNLEFETATSRGGGAVVTTQPAGGAWSPSDPQSGGTPLPRRRSIFPPGGNRLVYKRAFSTRSSSDDSIVSGSFGALPPPNTVTLDKSYAGTAEEFGRAWDSLETCASFRCRIGRLPEVETVASHLREQGFVVVASGNVSGRTKIYTCARAVGLEDLFYAELVFEKEMHELAFTFKCPDKRLTSRFVCHMHLRRVIGDHQPIA